MFTLIHNTITSSSNFNKQLYICNVCVGLDNLNKNNFPDAIHSHSKKCILGLTLSWYPQNTNSLMLSNFFNLIFQQQQVNPNEKTETYLNCIKGGGKVLLYWTLIELLKNETSKLTKDQPISLEVGSEDLNSIHKLINYYKSIGFTPICNFPSYDFGCPMQSTIEKVISSIDINSIISSSSEMNTFYSFLQTQTIDIQ
jgi:hypothetical protein